MLLSGIKKDIYKHVNYFNSKFSGLHNNLRFVDVGVDVVGVTIAVAGLETLAVNSIPWLLELVFDARRKDKFEQTDAKKRI